MWAFCGIFDDISLNVWWHSPEYLATSPGIFGDIPRNDWWHSLEYNISPIPHVPRIPFPVPVFLVLYILAMYKTRNTETGNGMRGTRGIGGMLYSGEISETAPGNKKVRGKTWYLPTKYLCLNGWLNLKWCDRKESIKWSIS